MRQLVVLVSILLLSPATWALDATSIRLKALGTTWQGLISDRYTDLLANPARKATVDSHLVAKYGQSGNPIALAYGSQAVPFVLAEGRLSRSESESASFNVTQFGSFASPTLNPNQNIFKSVSRNDIYDLVVLEGRRLANVDVGVGGYVGGSNSVFRSSSHSRSNLLNGLTGQTVEVNTTDSVSKNESKSLSPTLAFGLHWGAGESQKDRDLIFKLLPSRSTARTQSSDIDFSDLDPDGDGFTAGGSATTTPQTTRSVFDNSTRSRPALRVGGSAEFRSKKSTDDVRTGRLFSLAWTPTDVRDTQRQFSSFSSVSGASLTNSQRETILRVEGEQNVYSAAVGFGGMRRFLENAWWGLALRADASYSHRKVTTDRSQDGRSLQTSRSSLDGYAGTVNIPLSTEISLTRALMLRGSVTGKFSFSEQEEEFSNPFYGPSRLRSRNSSTTATFGAGLGYLWENIQADLFTTSDLLDVSNIQIQVTYAFNTPGSR